MPMGGRVTEYWNEIEKKTKIILKLGEYGVLIASIDLCLKHSEYSTHSFTVIVSTTLILYCVSI